MGYIIQSKLENSNLFFEHAFGLVWYYKLRLHLIYDLWIQHIMFNKVCRRGSIKVRHLVTPVYKNMIWPIFRRRRAKIMLWSGMLCEHSEYKHLHKAVFEVGMSDICTVLVSKSEEQRARIEHFRLHVLWDLHMTASVITASTFSLQSIPKNEVILSMKRFV